MPQAMIQNDKNAKKSYTDRSCHQEPASPGKHIQIISNLMSFCELCISELKIAVIAHFKMLGSFT